MTTVHSRRDTRIRLKETASLADHLEAEVVLCVQDGEGAEPGLPGHVRVHDTGPRPRSRPGRMTAGSWRMYHAVRRLRPDIVHFHDPELIPIGILLRFCGARVVYDVHEDLAKQIQAKPYIPAMLRGAIARAAQLSERLAECSLSAVVVATPAIGHNFARATPVLVQNYPLQAELMTSNPTRYATRPRNFVYVGGITAIRGIGEMVEGIAACTDDRARLHLVGSFAPTSLRTRTAARTGWDRVVEHGWADRARISEVFDTARAGLVLLHPTPNYVDSQPIKLFEYMSAGLPVIASHFPLWREIVEGAGCGLTVDPEDPGAIAGAMDWILAHPEAAEEMGRRGQIAVRDRYNWSEEAKTLLEMYVRRLGVPPRPVVAGAG